MSPRLLAPLVLTMLVGAVAAGDTPATQPGGPDRGTLSSGLEPAISTGAQDPAGVMSPAGFDPVSFFWIPLELPAEPGCPKRSFGGIVPPGSPPPALTALEEEKLSMARAAIESARAAAAPGGVPSSEKSAPRAGVVFTLQPDSAACLMIATPPLQEAGPGGLNAAEEAKCARLGSEGGRP
jgi:hypothetical protein